MENIFQNEENSSERTFDIEERIFPNGRIIRASHREATEYTDENGTVKFGVKRSCSADCGCFASLQDMYMCYLCQKIVCYRHTCIVPCAICQSPSFCHQCLILFQVNQDPPIPVCLNCLPQLKDSPFLIRLARDIWAKLFKKKEEGNEIMKR